MVKLCHVQYIATICQLEIGALFNYLKSMVGHVLHCWNELSNRSQAYDAKTELITSSVTFSNLLF